MRQVLPLLFGLATVGCAPFVPEGQASAFHSKYPELRLMPTGEKEGTRSEQAILAGGCFWGIEARFREIPGVTATAVGYIGGKKDRPTYKEVCFTDTGHAEAVIVAFDPDRISYGKLLDFFWEIHNPTTLNRQGPDVGSQYRSAIFTTTPEQQIVAIASIKKVQAKFTKPIVTEVVKAGQFWMAEEYHQQYHQKTGTAACPIDTGNRKGGG